MISPAPLRLWRCRHSPTRHDGGGVRADAEVVLKEAGRRVLAEPRRGGRGAGAVAGGAPGRRCGRCVPRWERGCVCGCGHHPVEGPA
ncbi:hypothetical protein SFRA_024940 [Streptomyces xinghaiensis]|uniref:Uncharacterized protein n=1 Tax=Streptomyces xinghaiensis TaxID=1038928 RepID=A0A3R7IZT8_9ACTN|nr:hypothetical protein SFRA_024940 [Streptomyces xinghaiensis]RNC70603.1 hypothetical protein DC095_025930 [Streptomyces xinghaiensis]